MPIQFNAQIRNDIKKIIEGTEILKIIFNISPLDSKNRCEKTPMFSVDPCSKILLYKNSRLKRDFLITLHSLEMCFWYF